MEPAECGNILNDLPVFPIKLEVKSLEEGTLPNVK